MADYSQVNDYSAKDALATGNPLKLIKGSDVDAEFSAIATAISSKFDSTDIATAGEAQAGVSNTVVITPARLTAWGQNGGGVTEDIQALADPGEDAILFWDDSASDTTWLTLGSGIAITGTVISVDVDGLSGRTLTAGLGLSGGGTLAADRTFTVDLSEFAVTTPAVGDFLVYHDTSEGIPGAATITNVNTAFLLSGLGDYDANDHIDHTAVVITAGVGLSYSSGGTDISASATLDLDINGLAEENTLDTAADFVVFYDASAGVEVKTSILSFVGEALGDGHWYRSSGFAISAGVETTVPFNAAEYDELTKGTFSISTGLYTRGADAGRITVNAQAHFPNMAEQDDAYVVIEVGGVEKARGQVTNRGQYGASSGIAGATVNLSLAATDVVQVRAFNDSGITLSSGTSLTYVDISELS
jgi:hypothetical protein